MEICKYGGEKKVIKHCHMCGEGLCSGCGYTQESNGKPINLCNECHVELEDMVNADRNVGLMEEQYSETVYQIDPERVTLEEELI